jgi:NAD(P)H-hydrate epimerase
MVLGDDDASAPASAVSAAQERRFDLATQLPPDQLVLVGPGNNGGGGLVAARHLTNAGADVHVALSSSPPLPGEVPERHRLALERMRIPGADRAAQSEELPILLATMDVVLDALLGYSVRGDPREPIAGFIRAANATSARRLALDLPSGLDGDTGVPGDPTVRANATLTLAWPKVGLLAATARPYVGKLYLADISVPAAIYAAVGVRRGMLFARGPIVHAQPEGDGWELESLDASGAQPGGEEG